MVEKLDTPCAAPKRGLPAELKFDYALGGWTDVHKGLLHTLRQKYGAKASLEVFERVCNMNDNVKNLTRAFQTVFNLLGNDCETIGQVLDVWDEFTGTESTILERSKTTNRRKVTSCPWKVGDNDFSTWFLPFFNIITATINPLATLERPKAMCAGDPYCEYIWKLKGDTVLKNAEEFIVNKLQTPCAAPKRKLSFEQKYDFVMSGNENFFRGWLYAIREKYGASAVLDITATMYKEGDRIKNMTNALLKVFGLEGNDASTIGELLDVWDEIWKYETTILERTPKVNRRIVTKCIWKVNYKDIGNYAFTIKNIMGKTVNSNATFERPKGMCVGDPYCEYIWRIDE
jgi:hypothetical protein